MAYTGSGLQGMFKSERATHDRFGCPTSLRLVTSPAPTFVYPYGPVASPEAMGCGRCCRRAASAVDDEVESYADDMQSERVEDDNCDNDASACPSHDRCRCRIDTRVYDFGNGTALGPEEFNDRFVISTPSTEGQFDSFYDDHANDDFYDFYHDHSDSESQCGSDVGSMPTRTSLNFTTALLRPTPRGTENTMMRNVTLKMVMAIRPPRHLMETRAEAPQRDQSERTIIAHTVTGKVCQKPIAFLQQYEFGLLGVV